MSNQNSNLSQKEIEAADQLVRERKRQDLLSKQADEIADLDLRDQIKRVLYKIGIPFRRIEIIIDTIHEYVLSAMKQDLYEQHQT